jgi:hypothetical protein
MNIPINIAYIPQLTDETTEKYNVDEYMLLYWSVPRNIKLHVTDEYIRIYSHVTEEYNHRLTDECVSFLI